MTSTFNATCCVCDANPAKDRVSIYRVNAKGAPGVWACRQHARQAAYAYAEKHGKEALSDEAYHALIHDSAKRPL